MISMLLGALNALNNLVNILRFIRKIFSNKSEECQKKDNKKELSRSKKCDSSSIKYTSENGDFNQEIEVKKFTEEIQEYL